MTNKKKNAHLILGKFANLEQLIKAYKELQADYTKKCQQIKELALDPAIIAGVGKEKDQSQNIQAADNQISFFEDKAIDHLSVFESGDINSKAIDILEQEEGSLDSEKATELESDKEPEQEASKESEQKSIVIIIEDSQGDKKENEQEQSQDLTKAEQSLGDKAKTQNEQKTDNQDTLDSAIERLFSRMPNSKTVAEAIGAVVASQNPNYEDLLEAYAAVLESMLINPQELVKDKQFLIDYVYSNQAIRDYIIEDYLKNLGTKYAPYTIKGASANLAVVPPMRAKNLSEAAERAKSILIQGVKFR